MFGGLCTPHFFSSPFARSFSTISANADTNAPMKHKEDTHDRFVHAVQHEKRFLNPAVSFAAQFAAETRDFRLKTRKFQCISAQVLRATRAQDLQKPRRNHRSMQQGAPCCWLASARVLCVLRGCSAPKSRNFAVDFRVRSRKFFRQSAQTRTPTHQRSTKKTRTIALCTLHNTSSVF